MEEIKRNIEMHACKKCVQTFSHMNVFVVSISMLDYDISALSVIHNSVLFTIRKRTPTILTGADYSRSFANIVNIRARFYT